MGVRRRRQRRIGTKLSFSLLVALAFLGALELAARLLGPEPTVRLPPGANAYPAIFQPDPILGWRTVPGAAIEPDRERLAWEAARGEALDQTGEVPVSPEGFRDTPLTHPRPKDEVRVLALGDSSVWGHGLRRLHTFSERIQAAMPEGVQVINGGVPGYSSYQALAVLEGALEYGLDGLLIYTLNSDVSPTAGTPDSQHFERPVALALSRLLHHSALFQWLKPATAPLVISDSARGERQRVHIADYRDNLSRFTELASASGAWVIWVIPPQRMDLTREPAHDRVTDQASAARAEALLAEHARRDRTETETYRTAVALEAFRSGAPALDGPELFWKTKGDPDELFVDYVHPSRVGHQLLAEALIPMVSQRLP